MLTTQIQFWLFLYVGGEGVVRSEYDERIKNIISLKYLQPTYYSISITYIVGIYVLWIV